MRNTPDDKEKQFFRNRFDDFESEPTDDVWENIQPQLPDPKPDWLAVNGKKLALLSTAGVFVFVAWLFRIEYSEKNQSVQPPTVFPETGKTEKPSDNLPKNAQNAIQSSSENTEAEALKRNVRKNAPDRVESTVKPEIRQSIITDGNATETKGNVAENRPVTRRKIDAGTEISNKGKEAGINSKPTTDKTAVLSNSVEETSGRRKKPLSVGTDRKHTETAPQEKNIVANSERSVLGKKDRKTQALSEAENTNLLSVANLQSLSVAPAFSFSYFGLLQARPFDSQFVSPASKSLVFRPVKIPQIESQPQKPPKSWQLYGGFAHWMNYYQVSPVQTDSVLVNQVQLGNALASQRSGWQLQAGAVYPLSERVHLRGGVFYLQQRQRIVYQTQGTSPVSTTIESADANSVQLRRTYREETHAIENRQQQWGVRVDALYQLGRFAAFRHYVAGGGQAGVTRASESGTSWSSGVQVGYGLVRPLGRTVEFWLEPTFRYTLQNPHDPLRVARIRPYAFGIQAGLLWRLPKSRR